MKSTSSAGGPGAEKRLEATMPSRDLMMPMRSDPLQPDGGDNVLLSRSGRVVSMRPCCFLLGIVRSHFSHALLVDLWPFHGVHKSQLFPRTFEVFANHSSSPSSSTGLDCWLLT